ncbi:GATOR1 complex protein NPRL3-like [Lytechinus pictus]|uniref:GATOR1 complex protein NPRL3-like n=1 Tax=Lytechinus pictus TaxID=7653 RepID=UPI0030B9BB24
MSSKVTPLSIILVSSGSKGYRLLFRYPFQAEKQQELVKRDLSDNPFALQTPEDDPYTISTNQSSTRQSCIISGELDNVLANILTPSNTDLCDQRFEVTVDDVKFVGHPLLVQDVNAKWRDDSSTREGSTINLFNVVFVLQASADWSLVHCYQDLSKRLALALKHEEKRCGYLSHQAVIMVRAEDEVAGQPEDCKESPFHLMLQRSKLTQDLRDVYEGLHKNGIARVYINNWIEVSFCLPHKVHNVSEVITIKHNGIEKSLGAIRPYHAMLLLEDPNTLRASLPRDCSPALHRIIHIATPLKRLQQLSQDADLALSQVFQLVGHLVYWGKATVIYPICGSNVYILSPNSPTSPGTPLDVEFRMKFGESLIKVLADFSLPLPLSDHRNRLAERERPEGELIRIVMWLLQKRLLIQLHTYVFIITNPTLAKKSSSDDLEREVSTPPSESSPVTRGRNTPQGSGSGQGSGLGENLSFDSDEYSVSTGFASFDSYSTEEGRGHPRRKVLDMLTEHLTKEEKASVLAIPHANNPEDIKLFARICPYLRGMHHLEEIMYYENVNRSQLYALLEKFREVLVTCSHQDAASVQYKEFL